MNIQVTKGIMLVLAVITVLVMIGVFIWDAGYHDGYLTGSNRGIFYKDIVGGRPDIDWEIEHMHDNNGDYGKAVVAQSYKCYGILLNGWEMQRAINSLYER